MGAALCALIAFKAGADPDAINEVFRSSALYRSKWEWGDYRENTINAGISACNGVFHRSKMELLDSIKFNEQIGTICECTASCKICKRTSAIHFSQGLLKYVYDGDCTDFMRIICCLES